MTLTLKTRGTVKMAMLPSLRNTVFPLSTQIKNLSDVYDNVAVLPEQNATTKEQL